MAFIFLTILCTLFSFFALDKPLLVMCGMLSHEIATLAKWGSFLIFPPIILSIVGLGSLYGLYTYRTKVFYWKYFPLCASSLFAEGFNRSLKVIIGRSRPDMLLKKGISLFSPLTLDPHYHSFPSGHATTAFALAFSLSFLYPKNKKVFLGVAALFALFRLLITHHFLSDILAGSLLGSAVSLFVHAIWTKKIGQAKEASPIHSKRNYN